MARGAVVIISQSILVAAIEPQTTKTANHEDSLSFILASFPKDCYILSYGLSSGTCMVFLHFQRIALRNMYYFRAFVGLHCAGILIHFLSALGVLVPNLGHYEINCRRNPVWL